MRIIYWVLRKLGYRVMVLSGKQGFIAVPRETSFEIEFPDAMVGGGGNKIK